MSYRQSLSAEFVERRVKGKEEREREGEEGGRKEESEGQWRQSPACLFRKNSRKRVGVGEACLLKGTFAPWCSQGRACHAER